MKEYIYEAFDYLHSTPEKGFEEFETSKYISKELSKFGYNVKDKIGGTGIIASIDSGKEGPIIAVRADMDALEFEIDGKKLNIHACGHDANSSMVLAAAKEVAEEGIKVGKIVFAFQPAEETLGGATVLCDSGLLDDVDEMIGIHLRPIQEARLGQATPALYHGSSMVIKAKINGVASHGARPHLGVNAVDAVALAINAVNSVRVDPRIAHSAKVTKVQTEGEAHNTIPDTVHMILDLRAQTNEVMDELVKRVKRSICTSVESVGASTEIVYCEGVPAAEYNEDTIEVVKEAISEVLDDVIDKIVTPGGEDFHFYTKKLDVKTAYIGLGADLKPGLHSPDMSFDKKALLNGKNIIKKVINKRLG